MNPFIRLLYALMIAASVVAFVIVTVISVSKPPEYPTYNNNYNPNPTEEELRAQDEAYRKQSEEHTTRERAYYKKVSLAVIPLTAVIIAGGLWLLQRKDVIGEGIALGGIATSVYAIVTASIADQDLLRLLAVTVLLAGALVLTHKRFLTPELKKK